MTTIYPRLSHFPIQMTFIVSIFAKKLRMTDGDWEPYLYLKTDSYSWTFHKFYHMSMTMHAYDPSRSLIFKIMISWQFCILVLKIVKWKQKIFVQMKSHSLTMTIQMCHTQGFALHPQVQPRGDLYSISPQAHPVWIWRQKFRDKIYVPSRPRSGLVLYSKLCCWENFEFISQKYPVKAQYLLVLCQKSPSKCQWIL